jgi:HK97 gp10 family phage protein
MATRKKTKFESRFPEAKKGAHEAVGRAVEEALIQGQETAREKIGKARNAHGYDLDPFQIRRKHFKDATGDVEGGMVFVHSDKWYYRFFETGTVYIPATPFMRPAHRVMRKAFENEVGDKFEGYVRRRVGRRV